VIRILIFALLAVLLLFPGLSTAQERKYVFTRIAAKDGLASSRVYTIMQDKKGFMWFGTASGLQRFDGRKMVMFRPPPGTGEYLPAADISQIFEDSHQNFWVRSGKEVGIFDPVTFRYKKATVRLETDVPPRSEYYLWPDKKGNIFLIITGLAVLVYDSATNEFKTDDTRIRVPQGWGVFHLLEDPKTGNYWMGADSGLAIYDVHTKDVLYARHNPNNLAVLNTPIFQDPVSALFVDKQYRLWINTWNVRKGQHFFCYDLTTGHFLPDTSGLITNIGYYQELHQFVQQSNGKLWAFGEMMLLEYNPALHRFNYIRDSHIDDHGIKYDQVFCAYEDKEENLWIGTDEGIYVFNPTREKFISMNGDGTRQQDLSTTSFLQFRNDQLLVATWGNGLILYDSNFRQLPNTILRDKPRNDFSYEMQWCLLQDKQTGKIWIGCQDGRLVVYDPASEHSSFYTPPIIQGKTIRQVVQDSTGTIWLATQSGLLLKWNAEAGYNGNFFSGFSIIQDFNTIIYRLTIDSKGFMWLCTHNKGLYKLDPATGAILEHYDTKKPPGQSLYSDQVADCIQYNDSLFMITGTALHILNAKTGKIRIITTADGMPAVGPLCLVADAENNIWMGSLNGICRFNYKRNNFTLFTQKDGIIQESFGCGHRLRNGRIILGSSHGFVFFQPSSVVQNSAPPLDVTITDFKLFNTYLSPDSVMRLDKIRLNYTQNSITIEFAALSFLQRDKIIYYYKLDGIDKDWIRSDQRLFANYPLLPPGDYTFRVMCENADGIESKNITSLAIYVKPPFWRTWWFMTLIVLLIAAAIYGLHRMRVNRLLDMEKVRTRIARDLHDDMGSTLSTINILSEMAKMKVASDSQKTGEYLIKISDNSTRMMEAMDDIVWSINPMNDSMQRITARMREFATGVLEAKNIDFSFRVDEQVKDLKLDMEARRDLFLIFKEAVNNLAKYSQCKQASIDLFIQKGKLFLKIQDNGIGFKADEADSGNGLINMKKRAQSLKGQLSIDSKPQAGTRILLEVPLT
jgi:ligand-binding sensor domain-containing protein/two-component sensor histidine kinase